MRRTGNKGYACARRWPCNTTLLGCEVASLRTVKKGVKLRTTDATGRHRDCNEPEVEAQPPTEQFVTALIRDAAPIQFRQPLEARGRIRVRSRYGAGVTRGSGKGSAYLRCDVLCFALACPCSRCPALWSVVVASAQQGNIPAPNANCGPYGTTAPIRSAQSDNNRAVFTDLVLHAARGRSGDASSRRQ